MEKKFSGQILAAIVGISVLVGVSVFLLQEGDAENTTYTGPPKALIIDQLFNEIPNLGFYVSATEIFESAGYQLDIVKTDEVTVDFYKNLPKMNYKYIVIRTHGADNSEDVVLFTGEKYTEDKYIHEQLFGQVKRATPLLQVVYRVTDSDGSHSGWVKVNDTTMMLKTSAKKEISAKNEYFAVAPKLVREAMDGQFDDTVFLLGGCNTMIQPTLANAFLDKGASLVVGWDNTVGSFDNDYAILLFLRDTLLAGLDTEEALSNVAFYHNPEVMAYPANLISLEAKS